MYNKLFGVKMQITNVSSYSQRTAYQKPVKQKTFRGLTKTFERAVYALDHNKADLLVDMYDKPNLFVGHFPKDIFGILKKTTKSGTELKQKIQTFNKQLADLAVALRTSEDNLIQNLDTINLDEYTYRALSQSAKRGKNASAGWVGDKVQFYLTPEEMEKQLNSSGFEDSMKKIGLISPDEKVKFTFIAKGTFKKCFKLDFLDANDKPLIHPKAYVIAQNADLGWDCNRYLQRRIGNYLQYLGPKGFRKKMEQQMQMDTISEEQKNKIRDAIDFYYAGNYKTSRLYDGPTIVDEFYDINGIFPEANAALKMRKDLGDDIEGSNVITPYIFGLKSGFGLLEFADSELYWGNNLYDFKKNGLEWLDGKYANFGKDCPKIVDFGTIVPSHLVSKYIV